MIVAGVDGDLGLAGRIADQVCLLNGRQWAAGPPRETLSADRLREAYGGRTIVLPDGRDMLVEW